MLWQSTNPTLLRTLLPEGAGWTAPCSCSSRCYYTPMVRSSCLPCPAPTGRGGLVWSTHTRKEWAREIILKKVTPQSKKRLWHLGITGHLWLASQVLRTQPGANGQVSSQPRLPQRECWGRSYSSEGGRFPPKHHRTGLQEWALVTFLLLLKSSSAPQRRRPQWLRADGSLLRNRWKLFQRQNEMCLKKINKVINKSNSSSKF